MAQPDKASLASVADPREFPLRISQVSRAVQGLRAMLLSGEFRPGERIPEIPVASKLGVSRSPLRLALEALQNEGLVKVGGAKGFVACGFSVEQIWDAIEMRGILEGAAARLAAERSPTPAQLEPLRENNREVESILNSDLNLFTDRYLELNRSFHSGITALADNQALNRALHTVNNLPFTSPGALVLLYKSIPALKELIPIARDHHKALVQAIGRSQGARAERIAREHSRLTRRNLELALSDWHLMHTIPGANLITFRAYRK